MKCNLCGATTHSFRDCPQSYANRTRQRDHYQRQEQQTQEHPPQEEAPTPNEQQQQPKTNSQQGESASDAQLGTPAPDAHHEGPSVKDQQTEPIPDDQQLSGHLGQREPLDRSTEPVDNPEANGKPANTQDPLETQDNLPAAQPPAPANSTAITAGDCRDFLDAMMADLPSPPEYGPHTPVDVAEESPQPLSPLPDNSPVRSTSQKRPQETSGDSSSLTQLDSQVWPSPLSTSSPFLDSQSLSAFSSATQMKDKAGEDMNWHTKPKKKKKKLKNPTKMQPPVSDS